MTGIEAKDAASVAETPALLRLDFTSVQAIIFMTSSSDLP